MHVEGEQPAIEEASDDEMAAAEQPSPSPAAAPGPAVAAAPRVQSKVVVPSPHTYDPRCVVHRGRGDVMAGRWGGAAQLWLLVYPLPAHLGTHHLVLPRSLRQLRREVADRLAAKQAS